MVWALAAALLGSAGCLNNPGVDPPVAELDFPTAMKLADVDGNGTADHLLVANSNFDLRYNSGTLQSYDLDKLLGCAASCTYRDDLYPGGTNCVIVSPQATSATTRSPVPGRDLDELPCTGLLSGEVRVGSFTSDMALAPDASRVYLSVRSESNLTYVDVGSGGTLSCGGSGSFAKCDDAHRHGDESLASQRDITLPLDPVALHVGSYSELVAPTPAPTGVGNYIVMIHRGGSASLFVEQSGVPTLVDVLDGLPVNLLNARWQAKTQLAWLSSGTDRQIGRVGVAPDASDVTNSYLFDAGSLAFAGISTGDPRYADTRDIAFDPGDPTRAFVLARQPQALLQVHLDDAGNPFSVTRTDGNFLSVSIDRQIETCGGASRVYLTQLSGQTVAFVSCFSNDAIYTIDLERGRLLGVTGGLSGPFVMAVDEQRQLLFVADFTTSVLRVMSLDRVASCLAGVGGVSECAPYTTAMVGIPAPVESLQ